VYVKTLNSEPKPEKRRGGRTQKKIRAGTHQTDNQEVERLNKKILALFPVYSARLEILTQAKKNEQITDEQLRKLEIVTSHAYEFDSDHDNTYLRDVAARSVMCLLIIKEIEASELIKRASSLAKGRFSDIFAIHRQKLWIWLRLRTSECDTLVQLVAEAVRNIKVQRAASSDKLGAIISLSRLILPVSRDDAESLFNDAVDIAKEIDQEAVDQIDFVSVLAERACIPEQRDRRIIASDIFAFVSGAAERLSDRDGFPWRAAVHALTYVDDIAALSAICRWADDGTIGLDDTLDRFLLTALQQDIIGIEASTSLAMLIEGALGSDLRKALVSRALAEPEKYKEVIEELAKDTLLLSPQDARLTLGQEIADLISLDAFQGGPWLKSLRDTIVFLKQRKDNKPEETTLILPGEELLLPIDSDLPKEFEFDPQGRAFTTPASMVEILQAAKASGLRHHVRDLLGRMRDVSFNPRDRIPFLNALAGVPEDLIWSADRIEMISETLEAWKGTPAVDRWCKEMLPSVLVAHFHGATRWLKEGQSILHQLLDCTGLDADGRLRIILAGVAKVGEALRSRTLFAIAEEIARYLDAEEAGALLLWYAERLRSRLPAEDQSLYSLSELPDDKTEAIARFLFALMSDIDTRIRWKAAHALRRLAKLGCFDIVKATASQSNRVKDDAFRDPTGPYYVLAAKLWLTISLYRISAETPEAVSSCRDEIFELAISSELPHVGIREYAKRALLQLASAGIISLTSSERKQIDLINTPLQGQTAIRNQHRTFDRKGNDKRRFKFNYLDTIPYWYEEILSIFPTVSQDQVLKIAERWILDKWGADVEANWWDKDPRKSRYTGQYELWSHSHGSFPKVERYGTHLEWNAMHCVIGELLTTYPLSMEDEDNYGSFTYWLGKVLPTNPPEWLFDNRGPTPLETRLWKEDPRTDNGWLYNIRRDEFLTEFGINSTFLKGWIVIEGYYSVHFSKRETNIRISSALVSPETAPALVRALQTVSNPWDFGIPAENDRLQIDDPPYSLIGWLVNIGGDTRFDEHDPFRYSVSKIRIKPGSKLVEALGLVPQVDDHRIWTCKDTREAALMYEEWCDEPPPEREYYPRRTRSDGWRLWARADMVRSFLANEGCDLICEVQVERRLRNEYGRSYEADSKRKTHDKILLLQADGTVADAKGRIGSWTGVSRGARP